MNIKTYINRNVLKYVLKYTFNLIIDFFLIIIFLFRTKINNKEFKLITISDSYFFDALTNLLTSIHKYEPKIEVVIIDIGLTEKQFVFLKDNFNYKIKKFNFDKFPTFFKHYDLDGKLGSYAWKAPALLNEFSKSDKNIIYLDAGCELRKSLKFLKFIILKNGFYSPESSNNIEHWTHPHTLKIMKVDKNLLRKRNFSSGIVGMVIGDKKNEKIIEEWAKFSENKDVLAPKGSSRKNHRQDQSILNILVHQNLKTHMIPRTHKIFGILKHQNKDVGLFN